jgi:thioredoxin-like negative regulator of GroEL
LFDDDVQEVAHSYCIQAAPTFVFIMDDLTLESFVGASPDKLRNTVKEFIDNTSAASASSSA